MSYQSQIEVESSQHLEMIQPGSYFKTNFISFCFFLIKDCLLSSKVDYSSLIHIKKLSSNRFPPRTVDRFIPRMVQFGFLIKLPRGRSLAYQLQINHPLLRLLLTIYYPEFQFLTSSYSLQQNNTPMLCYYKGQLDRIMNSLENMDDDVVSIANELFDILASFNPFEESIDELIKELFENILGNNSSDRLLTITKETKSNKEMMV